MTIKYKDVEVTAFTTANGEERPEASIHVKNEKGKEVCACECNFVTGELYFFNAGQGDLRNVWFNGRGKNFARGYTDKDGVEHVETYENNKLVRTTIHYKQKDGKLHSKTYDAKGAFKSHTAEWADEGYDFDKVGVYRYAESYDEKGHLIESRQVHRDAQGRTHVQSFTPDGKLKAHQLCGGDKDVMFDMNRKKFSWSTFVSIFDGSGRWGHVASAATSDSRIKVNAELRKIARGKELSDEKRRRARQVVAQYREGSEHCKTPNAKVGAALKNYLPSKGSR